jgi:uncharacterized membrane protein
MDTVLYEAIRIFLMSMIPGIESRFVVPLLAMNDFGWEWWQAVPIAIAGNIFLVPFILLFFKHAELYARRFPRWRRAMDWGFPKIRKRADKRIQQYETLALVIFVAIPLPLTGAGLGSLIAYLFGLPIKRSFLMILIGVIISTSITTFIYITTKQFLWH